MPVMALDQTGNFGRATEMMKQNDEAERRAAQQRSVPPSRLRAGSCVALLRTSFLAVPHCVMALLCIAMQWASHKGRRGSQNHHK
jgi:hypothetical protein